MFKIYLVGGAVRDELLGLPIRERDWVVVGATAEQLQAQGFQQVGRDFPVFLHPETKEEYALARTERKTGSGYHGFQCDFGIDVTLEQDLLRRDLTINAIAKNPETGELIDPYGGMTDLKNKLLKPVSNAFREDPLRLLRVARFYAQFKSHGFEVDPGAFGLFSEIVQSQELLALTPERVWLEFEKALKLPNPEGFIEILRETGALVQIFPALDKLWGVPQRAQYHPEIDTGVHIILALKRIAILTDNPIVRFAVLCHDLGKGLTPPSEWPSHKQHESRGVPLVHAFCDQYKIPNTYRDLAVKVTHWHLLAHQLLELRPKTILKLFNLLDVFRKPENLDYYLLACQADAQGRLGLEDKPYPQADFLKKMYQATQTVQPKDVIVPGDSGTQIRDKIQKARVQAIKNACRQVGQAG